jgi:DNA-binding response OmpR family regulator
MSLCWCEPLIALAPPVSGSRTTSIRREFIRVLLIEDDADAATLARHYLTTPQDDMFRVEWIPDLLDAMFRLQHSGVDVVLLDLGLADIDGYKSFRAVDGMTEGKIPIVILTADDRRVSRDLILASGAADYLTKQMTSGIQLRLAVRDAVCRFRPRSE